MAYAAVRFVNKWTSAILREEPRGRSKGLTQCLWGDWVGVKSLDDRRGWLEVRTRGRSGWLRASELTDERPLEVNFVDIGQGDGTLVVTPDDKLIVIDAGQGDNMYRFLKWRFNLKRNAEAPKLTAAVITHPDSDHYKGFQKLFDDKRFKFGTVFHSGIVERKGDDRLGPSMVHGGQRYLTDVITEADDLRTLLRRPSNRGRMQYPKLLWTALSKRRVDDVRALAQGDEVFPALELFGKELSMKVLAPVPERVQRQRVLRWFGDQPGKTDTGDIGKTKNGHSIVTVLEYGRVRILLGGDLNIPAEEYLLAHYGRDTEVFRCDVAKACHHGSADFSTEFIDRVRPLATVVSSGDDESHSHPRADTLGTVGKHSRGERSLIFSTELARSSPEEIIDPRAIQDLVLDLADKMVAAAPGEERDKARAALVRKLREKIRRSVRVYGMITLRTDGERVLMAQRLERPGSATRKWDMYPMVRERGGLRFKSKHAGH